MAHFAKVENGFVTDVIVIDNEYEKNAADFIKKVLKLDGEWIQTSYNNRIRNKFAGIGDSYDAEADVFIAPQPYPSWILGQDYLWNPPKQYPNDGNGYLWNEELGDWVNVETL